MSTSTLGLFLRHLALSEEVSRLGTTSDRNLLTAYESGHSEAAFTELMRRYGPMVLRTCRRVLGHGADAEDAFQATFLMLARKAGLLRRDERSLGGWLHHVAYQTARDVLQGAVRRKVYEQTASVMTHPHRDPSTEASWNEIRPILDAELDALPDEARRLLIAFYLEEKTYTEVTAELGLPRSSLARRLEKARALLAARLARRGITVSASLLAVLLEESAKGAVVPAVLLVHTVEAARRFTDQATGIVSENVVRLVKGGLAQMTKSWTHWSMALAGWLSLLGAGLIACQTLKAWPDQTPESAPPATERPAQEGTKPARTDCFGDPLPPGALARMGTVRLFYGQGSFGPSQVLAFSPDGKTLATHLDGMTVCLWDVATGKEIRRLTTKAVQGGIFSLGFSPDGKTLATMNCEQTVCRWEVATGKFLHKQEYQGPKRGNGLSPKVAFLPDGKIRGFRNFPKPVEKGKGVRGAYVWDGATGKEICQLNRPMKEGEGEGEHENTAFSRDGKMLATSVIEQKEGRNKAIIYLWDVATGKEIRQLTYEIRHLTYEGRVNAVAFSPDGKTLASGDPEKICVWEVATGKSIHRFNKAEAFPCNLLSYSPDGKSLLGGSERESHLWDVATGKEIRSFSWKGARAALFSPDGKTLAVGDEVGAIRLCEVATGKEIGPRQGYRGRIRSVAYSPDGKTLASMGEDETVRRWEVATGKEMRPLAKHARWGCGGIAYSPDGKMLVSMEDHVLHLWDTATGKEIRQFEVFNSHSAAFSPDGKILAAMVPPTPAVNTWMVYLLEVTTGKEIYRCPANGALDNNNLQSLAFSPDGRLLTVPGGENTVSLCEVATGKRIGQLGVPEQPAQGEAGRVKFLAFSPDGRLLAASSRGEGEGVRVWVVASGKEIWRLGALKPRFHEGCVLAFSPDGRMLATAAQGRDGNGHFDPVVRLWEVASGKEIGQLSGHQDSVQTIAFSPDGKTLASGSTDLTCLVWDVTPFGGWLKPAPARPAPPQALSQERLEAAWSELAEEPAKAYAAIGTLQAAPAQAIPLLRARVQPVTRPADPPQLQRWIADLDADNFVVREKAQREIEKLGEAAVPALRQALKGQPALEVKRRLQALLADVEPKLVGVSRPRLRELRAVQVLESIGTREAQQVLQSLARGVAEVSLTREAQAALQRLARRSASRP